MHWLGVCVGFFLWFILMSISPLIKICRYHSYTGITEGTITKNSKSAIRRRRDLDTVWWRPTYEYRVDNTIYYYENKIKMFYPPKIGKKVKVRYNIKNPQECEVLSIWMWYHCMWSIIGMAFAFVLFIHECA